MKRYPRSFLQLVTLGHFAVAVPLLILAGYAVFTLDQLSDHYQMVVQNVADSGRLSGELSEDIEHMELNLRRFEILKSPETLEDYLEVRQEWRAHMLAFSELRMLPVTLVQEQLAQLSLEETAHQSLLEQQNFQTLRSVIDEIRLRSARVRDQVQRTD